MRMIPKLQSGFTPVHYSYQPTTNTVGSAPASSGGGGEDDEGLLSEKVQLQLAQHALPSDLHEFVRSTNIFESSLSTGNGVKASPAKMKELLLYMNKMQNEHDAFEKNRDRINTIDAKGEAAISDSGGIFVNRGGKIQMISPKQLRKGEQALTNAQIMNIRANSTQHAFDIRLTSALENATSMKLIRQVIEDVLNKVEDETVKYNTLQSGTAEESSIIGLLSTMEITVQDLAKLSTEAIISREITNTKNAKAIDNAVTTIYSQLDGSMKTLIELRAKEASEMYGININPLNLVLQYIIHKSKNITSSILDIKSMPGGGKGKGDKDDKSQEALKVSALMSYAMGEGITGQVKLSPGNTVAMKVTGQVFGAPIGSDDKVIGPTSLTGFLERGFGPLVDTSQGVYFGDQKVSFENFKNVFVDGQQLGRVYLPATIDNRGAVTPNLKVFYKYEEISNKAQTKADLVKLAKLDPDLAGYIDDQGNLKSELLRPFFTVTAYATGDKAFRGHEGVIDPKAIGSGFISSAKSLGEDEDVLKQTMRQVLGTEKFPYIPEDNVYKGVVFLPINEEAVKRAMQQTGAKPTITAAGTANKNKASISDLYRLNQSTKEGIRRANFVPPLSTNLQ